MPPLDLNKPLRITLNLTGPDGKPGSEKLFTALAGVPGVTLLMTNKRVEADGRGHLITVVPTPSVFEMGQKVLQKQVQVEFTPAVADLGDMAKAVAAVPGPDGPGSLALEYYDSVRYLNTDTVAEFTRATAGLKGVTAQIVSPGNPGKIRGGDAHFRLTLDSKGGATIDSVRHVGGFRTQPAPGAWPLRPKAETDEILKNLTGEWVLTASRFKGVDTPLRTPNPQRWAFKGAEGKWSGWSPDKATWTLRADASRPLLWLDALSDGKPTPGQPYPYIFSLAVMTGDELLVSTSTGIGPKEMTFTADEFRKWDGMLQVFKRVKK